MWFKEAWYTIGPEQPQLQEQNDRIPLKLPIFIENIQRMESERGLEIDVGEELRHEHNVASIAIDRPVRFWEVNNARQNKRVDKEPLPEQESDPPHERLFPETRPPWLKTNRPTIHEMLLGQVHELHLHEEQVEVRVWQEQRA